MNERDWQSFVDEADSVKQAMLLARVSNDASEKADRQNKRLWIALAGSIIGNVILAIVMVCSLIYMQAHAQEMLNKGLENALQAIAEIQIEGSTTTNTTTGQTVEGDSAEINNVDGDMYRGNATHNEGVAD